MMRIRVARVIALVFHPVVPGFVVALLTAIEHEGGLTQRLWKVAGLVTAICVGLPLAATGLWFLMGRLGDDLYLVNRESRRFLYPVILVSLVLTLAVFRWAYPFELGFAMTLAAIAVSGLLAVANQWLKPSIHVAGLTAIAIATAWVHHKWAWPIVGLIPLVAWARITTKNHTLIETLVGAGIGAAATLAACLTLLV